MEIKKTNGQKTQDLVYDYVVAYISEHGYPPTIREIGDGVNLRSTATVYQYVQQLIKIGRLGTDAEFGSPRAIRVEGYHFCKIK